MNTPLNDIFEEWHRLTDAHTAACDEYNATSLPDSDDAAIVRNRWRAMQQFTRKLITDDDISEIRAGCYSDSLERPGCLDPDTRDLCDRALDNNDPEARWELWCYKYPEQETE